MTMPSINFVLYRSPLCRTVLLPTVVGTIGNGKSRKTVMWRNQLHWIVCLISATDISSVTEGLFVGRKRQWHKPNGIVDFCVSLWLWQRQRWRISTSNWDWKLHAAVEHRAPNEQDVYLGGTLNPAKGIKLMNSISNESLCRQAGKLYAWCRLSLIQLTFSGIAAAFLTSLSAAKYRVT